MIGTTQIVFHPVPLLGRILISCHMAEDIWQNIPYFSTFSFDINITAAAPSFNFDAFAAVIVPFLSNAGFIKGILSYLACNEGARPLRLNFRQ